MTQIVLVAGSLISVAQSASGQGLFLDTFNGYTHLAHIEPLIPWESTDLPIGFTYINNPTGISGNAVIPIRNSNLRNAFLQPQSNSSPAHWPLGRTCENFLRVEFDVAPSIFSSGGGTVDGRLGMYFTPVANQGNLKSTALTNNVGAGVEVLWKNGNNAQAQVWAKAPHSGNPVPVGSSMVIGHLDSSHTTRLRLDFGWDYFLFPYSWSSGTTNNLGMPWMELRVWYYDFNTGWHQANSAPGNSNGWTEFGTAAGSGYGTQTATKLAFDRKDWPTNMSSSGQDVYVNWYCDQGGSTSQVDWSIDNVSIGTVTPQSFTIMSNQLGYDTAAPQWVAMRPNDPAIRALGPGAITSLTWNLWDPSNPSTPQQTVGPLTNPSGEQCFNDVIDYENVKAPLGSDYSYPPPGFSQPVYWWRWEWALPVTTNQTGWFVTADGQLSNGSTFHVVSDPFDFKLDLYYSSLVADPNRNLAAKNASDREAVHTQYSNGPTDSDPGGGWFDAGAENGENRSQATFVSAFCDLLRHRRPDMTTAEIRDIIHQIKIGSDFLLKLGPTENVFAPRNTVHEAPVSRDSEGHHLVHPPTADEISGHIFHEHHTRYNGNPNQSGAHDVDDDSNNGNNIWMACAALADASRTLNPFDPNSAATYFAQASNTRDYLYALYLQFSGVPDYFIPYRAQAMLDFIFYDYTLNVADLDAGRYALALDLVTNPPHSSAVVGPWWTVGALLKNTYSGTNAVSRQVDPSAYAAVEPLLYCVENGVLDYPQSVGPHDTWTQALSNIDLNWYQPLFSNSTFTNPLRIGWYWEFDVAANDFYGQQPFVDQKIASEFQQTARLAQYFGKASTSYPNMIHLSLGSLNWLLGLHMGVLSRHVQSALGVQDTDLGHASASFINGVGRHYTKMVLAGLHAWTQPTIVTGLQGLPVLSDPEDPNKKITNWESAPFSYSRGEFTSSESFIKTDGTLIIGLDALGRVLHPLLPVEAEGYSSYSGFGIGSPLVVSNNAPASGLTPEQPNGGLSVINLVSGNQLTYATLMPPEPFLSTSTTNHYNYRVRLRASNTGTTTTQFTVVITQGTSVTKYINVPPTAAQHEYVMVDDGFGYSLPLLSGTSFSLTVTAGSPGPCAIDDIVFESEGVPF